MSGAVVDIEEIRAGFCVRINGVRVSTTFSARGAAVSARDYARNLVTRAKTDTEFAEIVRTLWMS